MTGEQPRDVGIFVFDDFEPLDVFGPLQVLGALRRRLRVHLLGPEAGAPVRSSLGLQLLADRAWEDDAPLQILLVPGGAGTRREIENERLLAAVRRRARDAELVTSACTGAAILARAGLLDGFRATTNNLAFERVTTQGPLVEWVAEARWVEDGNRVTSGGVAAGLDMAARLVERLFGHEVAEQLTNAIEYEWQSDSTYDPFAARAGLFPPSQPPTEKPLA